MKHSTTDSTQPFDSLLSFENENPFQMKFILEENEVEKTTQVIYANDYGCQFVQKEAFTKEDAVDFFSSELWEIISVYVQQTKFKHAPQKQLLYLPNDEHISIVEVMITHRSVTKDQHLYSITCMDRTSEEAERIALSETEEKYRSILEHNLDPLLSIDTDGQITFCNRAISRSFGYSDDQLMGKPLKRFIHQNHHRHFEKLVKRSFEGHSFELDDCVFMHANGMLVPIYMKSIPVIVQNQVMGLHFILRDTSPQIENKEKLFYLSYHDQLTGLWNLRALKEHLAETIRFSSLNNEEFTVVYVDLDRFKIINDSLGYSIGDELLQRISDRLNQLASRTIRLYRHSGDEFIYVLQGTGRDDAEKFAKKVLDLFQHPLYVERQEYFVSASLGMSLFPSDGKDMELLLRKADQALFYVKDRGRAHYRFYREDMNHQFPNEVLMESHLRRAIEMEELYIQYQPQINLQTGKIESFEALLRWNNRKFGHVVPSQFIPLAEESGLILQIGDWVLENVCQQLQEWQQKGYYGMRIAINISPKQFKQDHFAGRIEKMLKTYGVAPQSLEVEITESAMTNMRETLSVLQSLKQIGVVISVDDFGTGYSSLNYLKRYPIDIIKIDQSFIRDIEHDSKNEAIARTIIHLAHSLGMEVIAEGVERDCQVDILKSANCQKAQGFYFSKPVSVEEITAKYFHGA